MALEKGLADTPVGVPAPRAYHKITRIELDSSGRRANITVSSFYQKVASDDGKEPLIEDRVYTVSPASFRAVFGDALLTQGYAYLKTLPDFQGAGDA